MNGLNISFRTTDLQVIANDFTPEMFTVQVIEVLGTPVDTDVYVRDFVTHLPVSCPPSVLCVCRTQHPHTLPLFVSHCALLCVYTCVILSTQLSRRIMTGEPASSTRSAPFWSCMFDKMTRNSAFVK
jgi:hypothetical protein